MLQAGIELVGAPAPEGTIEALTLLHAALEAAGLENYRIGLGDASLYPAILDALAVPAGARRADPARAQHARLRRPGARGRGPAAWAARRASSCSACRSCAAGRTCSRCPTGPRPRPWPGCARCSRGLAPAVSARVIFDLGLSRPLGYYTGAIFEVYDAALGAPLGGGGRYDDLLGRFGRELPAVGWALNVERLHLARVGES